MPRLLVVVPDGTTPRVAASEDVAVVFESRLDRCHSAAEVAAATSPFVTLSPVAPTETKPGYGPPLGVAGIREAVARAGDTKVFALGGVTAENARSFVEAGAYGVAVMGSVLRADDPQRVVGRLLEAVGG